MNKKILTIGIVIVVILVALFVILYFVAPSAEAPVNEEYSFATQTAQEASEPPTHNETAVSPESQQVAIQQTSDEFTKPSSSFDLSDGRGTKLNTYDVMVTTEGFNLPDIVVPQGTMVQLNVTNKTNKPINVLSSELGLRSPSIAPETTINMSLSVISAGTFSLTCAHGFCPSGVTTLGKLTAK